MKKTLFLITILCLLIACNEKDTPEPNNPNNNTGTNLSVDTSQLFNKTWVYQESPTPGYDYTYKYYFHTNHEFDEMFIETHPDPWNPGLFITDTTNYHGTFSFSGMSLGMVNINLNYDGGASTGLGEIEDISLNELYLGSRIYYKE